MMSAMRELSKLPGLRFLLSVGLALLGFAIIITTSWPLGLATVFGAFLIDPVP